MHTGFGIMGVRRDKKCKFANPETQFCIPEIGYAHRIGVKAKSGEL
jgi:hypothetical protein